jgi:hypothetical protein
MTDSFSSGCSTYDSDDSDDWSDFEDKNPSSSSEIEDWTILEFNFVHIPSDMIFILQIL